MNPIALNTIRTIADDLRAMCGDDETLFADMTEGENREAEYWLQRLHDERMAKLEMVEGIKARMGELKMRLERMEAGADGIKTAIGKVLRAAGVTKWELPEASYSVRDGKPGLLVTNDDAVPNEFCRVKFITNKAAINEVYGEANELPNWLARVPASDIVTARTK